MRVKNHLKGSRGVLTKLALQCGHIPHDSLYLLPYRLGTLQTQVLRMRDEGSFRITGKGYKKGIGLSESKEYHKVLLSEGITRELYEYWQKYAFNDFKASNPVTYSRTRRNATTNIFMYASGINSFIDGHAPFRANQEAGLYGDYYSVRETRMENGEVDIDFLESNRTIRCSGLLKTVNGSYIIYSMSDGVIYKINAEQELRYCMQLKKILGKEINSTIVLWDGKDTGECYEKFFYPKRQGARRCFTELRRAYNRIYGIPLTKEGEKLIRLMTIKDWDNIISDILLGDIPPLSESETIYCHGRKDNTLYLNYGVPDIISLKRFVNVAEELSDKYKFVVRCFDFQESDLERLFGDIVEIEAVEFNDDLINYVESFRKDRVYGQEEI